MRTEKMHVNALKKRGLSARKRAAIILERAGYRVESINSPVYHLQALRKQEIRRIHVAVDTAPAELIRLLRHSSNLPAFCSRELWVSKDGSKDFEITCFN